MSQEQQKTLGAIALGALVLVILALVFKPLITDAKPSEEEVRAACTGAGAATGLAITQWHVDGRLKAAASIAAAMGYSACASRIKAAYGP